MSKAVRSSHRIRRRSWLRYSTTSQKVAVSIPGDIIGNIHCHNNFGTTVVLGVDSASNRNGCQEYFLRCKCGRCKWLTSLTYLCADFLETWKPPPPGTLRVCPGLHRDCFIFNCNSLWTQTAYITQIGSSFFRVTKAAISGNHMQNTNLRTFYTQNAEFLNANAVIYIVTLHLLYIGLNVRKSLMTPTLRVIHIKNAPF